MIPVKYKTATSEYDVELPEDLLLSKNFRLVELSNTKGKKAEAQYLLTANSIRFNELFQKFRERYAMPINPTSGYRQKEYNKLVGGSDNSMHLYACAVDFVDTYNKKDRWMISQWFRILYDANVKGSVNIYNNSGNYRYHMSALTDVIRGYKQNKLLVYTNYEHYLELLDFYGPLGVGVTYHGDL